MTIIPHMTHQIFMPKITGFPLRCAYNSPYSRIILSVFLQDQAFVPLKSFFSLRGLGEGASWGSIPSHTARPCKGNQLRIKVRVGMMVQGWVRVMCRVVKIIPTPVGEAVGVPDRSVLRLHGHRHRRLRPLQDCGAPRRIHELSFGPGAPPTWWFQPSSWLAASPQPPAPPLCRSANTGSKGGYYFFPRPTQPVKPAAFSPAVGCTPRSTLSKALITVMTSSAFFYPRNIVLLYLFFPRNKSTMVGVWLQIFQL